MAQCASRVDFQVGGHDVPADSCQRTTGRISEEAGKRAPGQFQCSAIGAPPDPWLLLDAVKEHASHKDAPDLIADGSFSDRSWGSANEQVTRAWAELEPLHYAGR